MARKANKKTSQSNRQDKDDTYQLEAPGRTNTETVKPGKKRPAKVTETMVKRSGNHWPDPLYTELECPACGGVVFLASLRDGSDLWLERQRRLVVFAGPYTEERTTNPETGEEEVTLIPERPMVLWEESTNRLVMGRPATEAEREHFKANRSLDGVVPWTIAHEGHLALCKRGDLWFNGVAGIRRQSLTSDRSGLVSYRVSRPQAEAMVRQGVTS